MIDSQVIKLQAWLIDSVLPNLAHIVIACLDSKGSTGHGEPVCISVIYLKQVKVSCFSYQESCWILLCW